MSADVDIVSIKEGLTLPVSIEQQQAPEGTTPFNDTLSQSVPQNSTVTRDKILASGKQCPITQLFNTLASTDTGNQDIYCRFIFDPAGANTVFGIGRDVFSSPRQNVFQAVGSAKNIRIEIKNGTTSALLLEAGYLGYEENIP